MNWQAIYRSDVRVGDEIRFRIYRLDNHHALALDETLTGQVVRIDYRWGIMIALVVCVVRGTHPAAEEFESFGFNGDLEILED